MRNAELKQATAVVALNRLNSSHAHQTRGVPLLDVLLQFGASARLATGLGPSKAARRQGCACAIGDEDT